MWLHGGAHEAGVGGERGMLSAPKREGFAAPRGVALPPIPRGRRGTGGGVEGGLKVLHQAGCYFVLQSPAMFEPVQTTKTAP